MTDSRIPKRDERKCDTLYDTVVLKDVPTKELRAVGYTCRLCAKEHLILSHGPDDAYVFCIDIYVRCSEQCGGFVRLRVKV